MASYLDGLFGGRKPDGADDGGGEGMLSGQAKGEETVDFELVGHNNAKRTSDNAAPAPPPAQRRVHYAADTAPAAGAGKLDA